MASSETSIGNCMLSRPTALFKLVVIEDNRIRFGGLIAFKSCVSLCFGFRILISAYRYVEQEDSRHQRF
jgi:hypothetical protein